MAIPSAASYLGTMVRLVVRGRKAPGGEPRLPRERLAVERTGIRVSPRQLARFLRVTDGEALGAFQGSEALLSPVFPAVWEAALGLELLAHPQAPPIPAGVLHAESECLPLRPLRLADTVRCRVEIERAEPHRRGTRLHLLSRNWNAPGQLCSENRMVVLLRSAAGDTSPDTPRRDRTPRHEGEDEVRAWEEVARWSLRGNHGRRYARVSGDYNPIHLWSLTARPFGFRRPILHGFCIEALVGHALIAHRCDGDPTRLRRLQITFRAPLLLPSTVSLQIGTSPRGWRFQLLGRSKNAPEKVCAEGAFVGG
ncbi:MAG TPA: MaoC/PaaZ C-terminal domain-containing protein [Longimicrobiaceae bacterium]|nr:MaoC/PaaZ C-terminal domain-containing protein [Longimicrobiaceae bacterium]